MEIKRHKNSSKEADPDQPSTWEEGKAGRKWLGMVFPFGQVDLSPPPQGWIFPSIHQAAWRKELGSVGITVGVPHAIRREGIGLESAGRDT